MRAKKVERFLAGLLALALVGLLTFPAAVTAASPAQATPAASAEPPRFAIEIRPEMELLGGVLAQTDWATDHGPSGRGSEYYRALKAFLAPYKDHPAVKIAEELTQTGFNYDRPPAFIAHLGSLPDLELKYEYSDYLSTWARGREKLEEFRLALRDLAKVSHFDQFIADWRDSLDKWVAASTFDADRGIEWLESFFGSKAAEYHVILAPSMPDHGGPSGYGAIISGPDGRAILYETVQENGLSEGDVEFPEAGQIAGLSVHEWGHFWVDTALEKHQGEVAALERLYRPVAKTMGGMAYGSVDIFCDEQVLRATNCLAAQDLLGVMADRGALTEEQLGFYLTRDVVKILGEYTENREKYPDFESFVPRLLERMADLPSKTDRLVRSRLKLGAVLMVLAGFTVAVVREARKSKKGTVQT